jgi:hypothetical protein
VIEGHQGGGRGRAAAAQSRATNSAPGERGCVSTFRAGRRSLPTPEVLWDTTASLKRTSDGCSSSPPRAVKPSSFRRANQERTSRKEKC